jgi:hypothetical protein
MVDYMLCSTPNITHQKDESVTSFKRGVFAKFEDWYYNCFSPGRGECVFITYTVVHAKEKALGSWKQRLIQGHWQCLFMR